MRRRSRSSAATSTTAYPASTPNWTSSSRIPAWVTSTDRSTESRIVGSLVVTDAWFDPGSAALTRPSSPETWLDDDAQALGPESRDVGDRPPLGIQRLGQQPGREIVARDHERPPRGEPAATLQARQREGLAQPVGIRRIGPPRAGDLDLHATGRVQAADQREAVTRAHAQRTRRGLGHGGLHGIVAGLGPPAVEERGVAVDALERCEHLEVGDGRRIGRRVRVGRGPEHPCQLAAGGRQHLLQLGGDRGIGDRRAGRA